MVAKQIVMSNYSTNLTEKQWQVIKNIVEPQERTRKKCLREILNAIFYISKSGCQWRMLPSDFAPWQTVYYYFRKWKLEGVLEELLNVLHCMARKSVGKQESPRLGIIDSRSVKTSHHVDTDKEQKIKGRKEKINTDSLIQKRGCHKSSYGTLLSLIQSFIYLQLPAQRGFNCLKKSLPLSSTRMNAGKSSTSIFQIASIPNSGYSTHSMLLILF